VRIRRIQSAFTLLECLMASALLAFIVAAVCQAVVAGQMQTAESLHSLKGMALAEMTMEEILALPYDDPQGSATAGPDTGETSRTLYDNVDDYHNFSMAAGAIKDGAGSLLPSSYQGFNVAVTASYTTRTVTGLGTNIPGLNVTVTAADPGGRQWVLQRFIAEE
jgi:MSHA pilin protein MshD